jgi:hypothetical protein
VVATGRVSPEGDDWSLPSRVRLAGPLHFGDGDVALLPASLGIAARFRSASTDLPFSLGAHGPMRVRDAVWSLQPAILVLRGDGPIPDTDARGALAFGQRLVLRLQGTILEWPDAWPALPPPLSASTSPMPFVLGYAGRVGLDDTASLALRRNATTFDARFRLPAVTAWLDAGATGSPLPPLTGRLSTPRLDIAGAQLEGVEVSFDDPAIDIDPVRP